jgi:hypothetical protein
MSAVGACQKLNGTAPNAVARERSPEPTATVEASTVVAAGRRYLGVNFGQVSSTPWAISRD